MKTQTPPKVARFLVAKKVGTGFQKVSIGSYFAGTGASHSFIAGQKFGMTEAEHADIIKAAEYLCKEPGAFETDLESGYRVTLL